MAKTNLRGISTSEGSNHEIVTTLSQFVTRALNIFQVEDEKANCFADMRNKNKRIKFEIFNSNIFNIKKDFFPDDIKFKI